MTPNIHGKMVYSFEQPMWHAITKPCTEPMTAEEVLNKKFQNGIKIALRQAAWIEEDGSITKSENYKIVRMPTPFDDRMVEFGDCTERYHPLQPMEIAQSYDMNINQNVETMAFLGDGQEMFISWKMPSFELGLSNGMKDLLNLFGIIRCGFDTLKGCKLFTATYRPVCENTINLAEGWARKNTDGKGQGMIWTGKAVNKNLLRDLGYWMSHVQGNAIHEVNLMKNLFSRFAEVPVKSDEHAKQILAVAYPDKQDVAEFYPKELKDEKRESINLYNESQGKIRDGIYDLFSGNGTAITPDFWGMLNATSEYFCHVMPSKKPIAESVMFGKRQENTMQMISTLSEMAR